MIKKWIEGFLDLIEIISGVVYATFGPVFRRKEIFYFINHMAYESLPIILLSTAFAGVVVTSEMAFHMDLALHTVEMMPGFSGQFIFRELGIAIPALLLVAKVGASTTAELATMKVTEQIDALKLLGINPIYYLVYPRFIASMVVVICLTFFAILVTLVFAILVAVIKYNFTFIEYLNKTTPFLSQMDVLNALTKSACFGAVMPIISSFYGFRCSGGAEGVGLATTNSVVTATVVIIILDFLITYIFSLII
jgi:phospholipid/cholesterol/gamma-HCH transport system permease protein